VAVTEEIARWIAHLPPWQQDLARRVQTSLELDEEALEEALRAILADHDALEPGEVSPEVAPLKRRDLATSPTDGRAQRIISLGNLRDVGAVAPGQEMRFLERGITVIHGHNGAGKSSYVRALKRICRTVDRDSKLLSDVFNSRLDQLVRPTARLETLGPDGRSARDVDLAADPDPSLAAISVFDTAAAALYVNKRNTVAYLPSALTLLTRLAATQDRLRQMVQVRMAALRQPPDFSLLPQGCEARTRAEAITAETDVAELRVFCELDEIQRSRMADLRKTLASEGAGNQQDVAAAKRDATQVEALRQQLIDLRELVDIPAAISLARLVEEAHATAQAAALAAAQFASQPVSGVGGDPWQRLWQAARDFWMADTRESAFPPVPGAHCGLCLQQVDQDAAVRMRDFEQHVRSDVQRRADTAKEKLVAALGRLDPELVTRARSPLVEALRETAPQLHAALEHYIAICEQRMHALRESPPNSQGLPPVPEQPLGQLHQWAAEFRRRAATLEASADPRRREQLQAELVELEGRERLRERIEDIETHVGRLRREELLKKAYESLSTRRITSKQNALSRAAVSDALEVQLIEELVAMKCEHLPVDTRFRGAVGSTVVQLILVGSRPAPELKAVLSEGEQRAVALAFFLAEIRCADHDGGLVLDEPVAALDDERRAYVAQRLVKEAANRQVVVFTYDTAFARDLAERAGEMDVPHSRQSISRRDGVAGLVGDQPPPKPPKPSEAAEGQGEGESKPAPAETAA
jgi:energy-coupling factor transporter ATP-binding protein EcfA2